MKATVILLFGFCLSSSELFVLSQKYKYELLIFQVITEVCNDEETNNLGQYLGENTTSFTEENPIELCKNGFQLVKTHKRGQDFLLLESTGTEKIKPYVFRNFNDKNENNFRVLFAYECTTLPPTYIHVHNEKSIESTVSVIFKDILPLPTFNKIHNYQMKLVEEIREATVEDIISAERRIVHSLYDADELSDERRMQMCQRGRMIIPEVNIQIQENTLSDGRNRYYVIKYKENRGIEGPESWRTVIIQAFDCPSEPKVYINLVGDEQQRFHCMWAIVKENSHRTYPILRNITGYYMVQVKSVALHQNKKPVEFENDPEKSLVTERNKLGRTVIECDKMEGQQRVLISQNQQQLSIEDVSKLLDMSNETNKQLEEERREICKKALKVVSGWSAEFTDGKTGPKKLYSIEKDLNQDILDVVEAYECPTNPKVYLYIDGHESIENMVWVIVQGKTDFERLNTRFKK